MQIYFFGHKDIWKYFLQFLISYLLPVYVRLRALRDFKFSFAFIINPATLLKVKLLHGCFSRFLNCANGTKLCNASHINVTYTWDWLVPYIINQNISCRNLENCKTNTQETKWNARWIESNWHENSPQYLKKVKMTETKGKFASYTIIVLILIFLTDFIHVNRLQ